MQMAGSNGVSLQGPPGPRGIRGVRGPTGQVGPIGKRGQQGPPGSLGGTGSQGNIGVQGLAGKDAKQAPTPQCTGLQTNDGESICCGLSRTSWSSYYDSSTMRIDTSSCKFTGNVRYFTTLQGSSYTERLFGISNIYDPTATGFRLYLYTQTGHISLWGWYANAWRYKVRWCGVGKSNGPRVPTGCCGTDSAYWYNGWTWDKTLNAKACDIRGSKTTWITAVEGFRQSGIQKLTGMSAGTVNGASSYYVAISLAYSSNSYWGQPWNVYGWSNWRLRKGQSDALEPRFCLFGDSFPTGDMRLLQHEIRQDEFPCQGMRLIEENVVKTNKAQICCGTSDSTWKVMNGYLMKDVDTTSCNFDDSNAKVIYMTSLGGDNNIELVTGAAAYSKSNKNGFTVHLASLYSNQQNYAKRYNWKIEWCGIGERR